MRQVKYSPQHNAEERQCWICFEGAPGLIRPCKCDGSMKWVHRRCLDKWRVDASNPRNFTHCRHCDFKFQMVLKRAPTRDAEELRQRRRRFVRRTIANFSKSAFALQAGLCLVALILRAIDQKEALVTFFNLRQIEGTPPAGMGSYWNAVLHHKSTYYLASMLLAFFVVGLSACVGMCRGYWASRHSRGSLDYCPADPCPNDCLCCPHDYWAMRGCQECCNDCCFFGRDCRCSDCPACECNPSLFCPECECASCACGDAGELGPCAAILLAVLVVAVVLVILAPAGGPCALAMSVL